MSGKGRLPKILTTASVFALINAAANSAVGAEATSQNNPSSFNTSDDWDIARILANQDYITLGANHAITADLGIYIEDIAVGANTLNSLNIDESVQLGNVTVSGGTAGQVVLSAGNGLTLVGGDRTYREAGINAVAADYSGVSGVNFSGASSLTTDAAATVDHHVSGSVAGVSDAITIAGAVTNGANGTLNVNTDLNVSDASWFEINAINIGSVSGPATFAADLTAISAIDGSGITFVDVDSELSVQTTGNITLSNSLGGASAGFGDVTITTTSANIAVNDGGSGQIGVDAANQANTLTITGGKNVTVNVPVYAKNINIEGFTGATFSQAVTGDITSATGYSLAITTVTGDVTLSGDSQMSSTGTINGDLAVSENAQVDNAALNVTGTATLSGTQANQLGDVGGAVTSSSTSLIMQNAGSDVTITAGAGNIQSIAGDLSMTNGDSVEVAGDIDGSVTIDDSGAYLYLPNGSTIGGDVDASGPIITQGNITLDGANVSMSSLSIEASNIDLTVNNADLGASSVTTLKTDKTNDIIVKADQNLSGTIGSATKFFGNFTLGADVTVNIDTASFYADNVITSTDDTGTVNLGSDGTFARNLGDETNSLNTVGFDADVTMTGNLYANNINVSDGNSATFSNNIGGQVFNIGAGTVVMDSSGGSVQLEVDQLNFTSDDGGKIVFTGANDALFGAYPLTATGGRGIIEIDSSVGANTIEIYGTIGDNATDDALNLLDIKGDSIVSIGDDSSAHINSINFDADGTIELNGASNKYKFGEITTSDGNGTLSVVQNSTLESTGSIVNLGTSSDRLKALNFTSSRRLNVEDGINIYVDTITQTSGTGTFYFYGTSILDINTSSAFNVGDVSVEGGGNLTFVAPADYDTQSYFIIKDNATLIFNSDVQIGGIGAGGSNQGVLKFENQANMSLTDTAGGAIYSLESMEFAGEDVVLNAEINGIGEFKFTSATPMVATFVKNPNPNLPNVIGGSVFTNTSGVTHTVVLSDALASFTQDLATSTANQLNFQLDDGVDAEITGGDATGSNFTTGTNSAGELTLNNSGMTINSAGASSLKLAKVTFTEDASVTKNLYASEISIADTKNATIGGVVAIDKYSFGGNTSQVTFAEGATISAPVVSDAAGGVVEFAGDITLSSNIGADGAALSEVKFADDSTKTSTLKADIYATSITANKGTVALDSDVKITGDTSTNSTNFNLASYNLENDGDFDMSGDNVLQFDLSDTGSGTTITGGALTNSGVLSLANGGTLTLKPQDSSVTVAAGNTRQFLLVSSASLQGIEASQIEVVPNTANLDWTVIVDENGISLLEDVHSDVYLQSVALSKLEHINLVNRVSGASSGSFAERLKLLLGNLVKNSGDAKLAEAIERITSAGESAGDAKNGVMSSVVDSVADRALTVADISLGFASVGEKVTGVAAGDARDKIGAWVSPFYGYARQGERGNAPGYDNKLYGVTVGFDSKINDELLAGVSASFSSSDIKHRNFKTGDSTKMKSYLFSVYGTRNLTENSFWVGSATIARNDIDNHSRRVASANDYQTANTKYTAYSFIMQNMLGYNAFVNKAVITPMVGLKYRRDKDTKYQETGTTLQNLTVTTKGQHKVEVVAGAKGFGYLSCGWKNKIVSSEVRGFVNYALNNHTTRSKVNLGGVEFISEAKKPARLKYNLGVGVNASGGGLEYGASYDLNLSDKLVGHQGSIKLRAEF